MQLSPSAPSIPGASTPASGAASNRGRLGAPGSSGGSVLVADSPGKSPVAGPFALLLRSRAASLHAPPHGPPQRAAHLARAAPSALADFTGDGAGDPKGLEGEGPLAAVTAKHDALDGPTRHAAQLGPPPSLTTTAAIAMATPATAPVNPTVSAYRSLEDLLPSLVRKIAWSGDGRSGALRMEVGAGALAGASLLVQSTGGRVHVSLRAPPGIEPADAVAWGDRIRGRLAAKGLDVDAVEVE